jgi:hypothetical protein
MDQQGQYLPPHLRVLLEPRVQTDHAAVTPRIVPTRVTAKLGEGSSDNKLSVVSIAASCLPSPVLIVRSYKLPTLYTTTESCTLLSQRPPGSPPLFVQKMSPLEPTGNAKFSGLFARPRCAVAI